MPTLKTYLRIQPMIFVFGIVGPIFLVIYFSVQPDPTARWLHWCGLPITFAGLTLCHKGSGR